MSVPLTPIDTSAYQVGATGRIDWTNLVPQGGSVGTAGRAMAHVRILNESGCGILVQLQRGAGDHVPAGGWLDLAINGDTFATYTVEYVLAGPSPNLILVTVYEPGERVPALPVLGNSPVGVGGTVKTSAGTSIQNDGNGPGTQIIEATPSDQAASAIQIFNDGSGLWKILSAGSLRTLLNVVRGNATTGHAVVDIGDAADKTAFTFHGSIGSIHSDGTNISSDGAGNLTAASFNGPLHGNADTATNATNATNATTAGAVSSNGGSTTAPQLQTGTVGAGIAARDDKAASMLHIFATENDATARSIQLDAITAGGVAVSGPHIALDNPSYRYTGQLMDVNGNNYPVSAGFSGTGSGTYNHNLKGGKPPTNIQLTCSLAGSTQTMGYGAISSTTVAVTTGAGYAFGGLAMQT